MNPELQDIQDKINYLEWQLKNKLEEAASLKKRVDGLRETRAAAIRENQEMLVAIFTSFFGDSSSNRKQNE
jgi:hypothetical protein